MARDGWPDDLTRLPDEVTGERRTLLEGLARDGLVLLGQDGSARLPGS